MSIAWSTVVLIVLLLPGFFFFAGLYFPELVSRESAPISPLGQLSGVVGIAFLLHAVFFIVINQFLCPSAFLSVRCVAIDHFIPVLRADATTGLPPGGIGQLIDGDAWQIVTYFVLISAVGFFAGFLIGKLIELGPLRRFARHPWMYELMEGKKGNKRGDATAQLVRAHVLSKTSHDGKSIIYDGIVTDFYAKADGTIYHLVLKDARTSILRINNDGARRQAEPRALALNTRESGQFLLLTNEDIANIYFERTVQVRTSADGLDFLRKRLDELRSQSATGSTVTRSTDDGIDQG